MNYKGIFYFLLTVFCVAAFQNCGQPSANNSTSSSTTIESKANFTWINENIVKPKCLECHNDSLSFAGLKFTDYEGVMEAVVPGSPDDSDFYTRAFRTISFSLTDEELQTMHTWIAAGAPNN